MRTSTCKMWFSDITDGKTGSLAPRCHQLLPARICVDLRSVEKWVRVMAVWKKGLLDRSTIVYDGRAPAFAVVEKS